MIATESHRRGFAAALGPGASDVTHATSIGAFLSLDAATTMATFIDEGIIDLAGFHEEIGALVRAMSSSGRRVRVYGEMVALLWEAGHVRTAIELETLWNELQRSLPFSLLCAYPAAAVTGVEVAAVLEQICCLHSSVLHRPDPGGPGALSRTAYFPIDVNAVSGARHFAVDVMERWGCSARLIEDAALVSTELATNAFVHARTPFTLELRDEDAALRISVHDAAPLPAPTDGLPPTLTIRNGHGLHVISCIASEWGVECVDDGKVVWAVLRRPQSGREAGSAPRVDRGCSSH